MRGKWRYTAVRVGLCGLLAVVLPGAVAGAGIGFTAPAALNTTASSDARDDFYPQVTTDGAGHWVAVWRSTNSPGGTLADILAACSADNGATWSVPQPLSADSDALYDSDPQVATDGAGHWLVVWDSHDTGTFSAIMAVRSTDNGTTWTAPQTLSPASDTRADYLPQVTTDGTGHWVAVWQSSSALGGSLGTDVDILVARSTDNGATWTAPQPLNSNAATDTGSDIYPQMTTDRAGCWLAVWTSPGSQVWRHDERLGDILVTETDISVARSTDNGATWTSQQVIDASAASDVDDDFHAQVATDGAGHWVAVWMSFNSLGGTIGTDKDILVARSIDNGATWTEPQALNTDAATDTREEGHPRVTTDGAGHWLAVWNSSDSAGGALGTDVDILVARSMDNGATWTAPQALSINAASDVAHEFNPQVATDGAGHWLAVWELYGVGGALGTDKDILQATMDRVADTDGDGVADASETNTGTYVDDWDTGTDPASADTDGDTLPDGWEVDYTLDPFTDDADQDLDGDGFSNAAEHAAGTNPGDPASHPVAADMPVGGPAGLALTAAALAALAWRARRR